jgi:hypothetical protein
MSNSIMKKVIHLQLAPLTRFLMASTSNSFIRKSIIGFFAYRNESGTFYTQNHSESSTFLDEKS